jgi:hypothetical protein
MENQAEEYIKALQTTIATKQVELDGLTQIQFKWWNPLTWLKRLNPLTWLKRRKLRDEINKGEQLLEPLLKQAQGIRQ